MKRSAPDESTSGDDTEGEGSSTRILRSRLTDAAAELSGELHRSPRPSEVAERAGTDVDNVVESVAHQGPIADEYADQYSEDTPPGA